MRSWIDEGRRTWRGRFDLGEGMGRGKGGWARRVGYRGGSELEGFRDSRRKLLVRCKGRLLG